MISIPIHKERIYVYFFKINILVVQKVSLICRIVDIISTKSVGIESGNN